MTSFRLSWLIALTPLVACSPSTNAVQLQLAPDVVSSIDGTLSLHAIVLADREPSPAETVQVTVSYTDRNGTAHDIAPVDGTTDDKGAFDATLTGLTWDGTGAVTVQVMNGSQPLMDGADPVQAVQTFAVLDRTPPQVTINPPANNTVQANQDTAIQIHVTDEIGISQVWFEWNGTQGRQRSSVVASGSTDATVTFDFQPQDTQIGQTLMLYALAEDLSGNQAAAQPISVTVQ